MKAYCLLTYPLFVAHGEDIRNITPERKLPRLCYRGLFSSGLPNDVSNFSTFPDFPRGIN